MNFAIAFVLFVAAAGLHLSQFDTGALHGLKPDGPLLLGLDAPELAVVSAAFGVLFLILHIIVRFVRGRNGQAARGGFGVIAVAALAVGGYNYRDEISQMAYRIAGELGQPPQIQVPEQTVSGEKSIKIRRRKDGHFTASVTVNGNSVAMLVDTGASTVVLRQADARKLGVDTSALKFSVPVQTANGVAYAAHVRLRNVTVGPIALAGVDALVAQPGVLKESLLGMSFLSRLRSYEFSGQFLTFRQ